MKVIVTEEIVAETETEIGTETEETVGDRAAGTDGDQEVVNAATAPGTMTDGTGGCVDHSVTHLLLIMDLI